MTINFPLPLSFKAKRLERNNNIFSLTCRATLLTEKPLGTTPGTNLGINGLRTQGKYLYFTNSAQGIFGRVPINKKGEKTGAIEILATRPEGLVYDDIAIDGKKIWIATHPSQAVRVNPDGSQTVIQHDRLLLNPTSAAFGRGGKKERKTVYITNGGEFSGADLINSGVVAIDT